MKKLIFAGLVMVLTSSVWADSTITNLTADTSPTVDDLLITVNDPGGTAANRKVTIANLFKAGDITIVSASGNVGLGVASPAKKLDVLGAIGATGAITGSNLSGTNTGDQTTVSGNAGTVTFADAAGDTTTFPALGTAATGSLAPATDAGLSYNATTNALTTTTFIGALTGNASTATALAANGTDCSAGSYPRGVDASGNAETCTSVSGAGSQWITTTSVGIGTTDNVGIGTTIPGSALIVMNGNVGIGSRTPGATVDVTGTVRASTALQVGLGTGVFYGDTNGNVGVGTSSASTEVAIGKTGQIRMDSNGNLGVGTTAPPQKLYVAGTGEFQGFKLNSGAAASYVLTSNSVGVGTWMPATGGGGSGTVNTGTANYFAYYPASNTTVDDNTALNVIGSNVGIGTAAPGTPLDVVGGSATLSPIRVNNTTNSGLYLQFNNGTDITGGMAEYSSSAGGGLYIFGNRDTSNAGNALVLDAVSTTADTGTSPYIILTANNGGSAITVRPLLAVQDNYSTEFLIDADGNVGIGSASPGADLDVTGTMRVSSSITASGAGNVGIGTTIPPTKLYVVGTGTFTTGLNVGIGTASPTRLCIANNVVATCAP